jgi:hypothetical protein
MHATCPAHLILLALITLTILGEEYKPCSSSLFSFLQPPVTSSLLGPNILLHPVFKHQFYAIFGGKEIFNFMPYSEKIVQQNKINR